MSEDVSSMLFKGADEKSRAIDGDQSHCIDGDVVDDSLHLLLSPSTTRLGASSKRSKSGAGTGSTVAMETLPWWSPRCCEDW